MADANLPTASDWMRTSSFGPSMPVVAKADITRIADSRCSNYSFLSTNFTRGKDGAGSGSLFDAAELLPHVG